MRVIKIGYDDFLKKDVKKIEYGPGDLPKLQLFNPAEVIAGHASSNIAIAFAYTWKADRPPEKIREYFNRLSNYAALTGYWRTTNGGRYIFSNILANPNINKLIVLVFGQEDNGHLLVDALVNFWKNGVDKKGLIINSSAQNARFEQVPIEGLERIRKQADLMVMNCLDDADEAEKMIKVCIQEPQNSGEVDGNVEFVSHVINNGRIYDDGCRFEEPHIIDLSGSAKEMRFEPKNMLATVGQSVQAKNLEDGIEQVASFVFRNGSGLVDERGIVTIEVRSLSMTVLDPLEKIPEGFSEEYIKKYVEEFMEGKGGMKDDFAYTYHDRIFRRWGNQVEKVIDTLKKNPNTRRAMISLWDQNTDIGDPVSPCLDFIWPVVRDSKLEFHVVYRSHHLATVTEDGKLMMGEGALVPNLYALATLQKHIAEKAGFGRGPLVLTDFSGHLYVSKVKS